MRDAEVLRGEGPKKDRNSIRNYLFKKGNKLTRKSLAVISGGRPAKRTRWGSRDKGSLLGNAEVDGVE